MTGFEKYSLLIGAIQSLLIILGFVLAYRQLRLLRRDSSNTLELNSRKNAMELISRYSDDSYIARRIFLRTDENIQKDYFQCAYLLNFFEELAIAIKHKTANESLLEDFFGTVLRQWMEEEYILSTLKYFRQKDSDIFENILWLYRKWESKRDTEIRINSIPELNI